MTYSMIFESPFGPLKLVSNGAALTRVMLPSQLSESARTDDQKSDAILKQACTELECYFAGTRTVFGVPTAPEKGTEFQRRLDRVVEDSDRIHDHLRRAGNSSRATIRGEGRRCGEWAELHPDHCALSPGDRFEWRVDRVCRRSRPEATVARSRAANDESRLMGFLRGIGVYSTFHSPWGGSQTSLRVCGEGCPNAIWPNRGIIRHISPLLAGARLSPGRVEFLCRSCVDTNASWTCCGGWFGGVS
jgi:hypothetical protein